MGVIIKEITPHGPNSRFMPWKFQNSLLAQVLQRLASSRRVCRSTSIPIFRAYFTCAVWRMLRHSWHWPKTFAFVALKGGVALATAASIGYAFDGTQRV